MHFYKYGVLINQLSDSFEWRVAFLDGSVSDHCCITVPSEKFNFPPTPGATVKAKFEHANSFLPSLVAQCGSFEWFRDVTVVNSKVVIFAIVHFSNECLERDPFKINGMDYSIIENENTDFQKIVLPTRVLQTSITSRSNLQNTDTPFIYRIGVCWEPISFENGVTVNWRYYADFPITPIFELYYRETTLPYIAESMVYGVLEGVVIAENDHGALFWTPKMGCAILPSTSLDTPMPSLGSVHVILVKRCIPENSFGFSCSYELLSSFRSTEWPNLKVITDQITRKVYIEANASCRSMMENQDFPSMNVPHIGKVFRGLQQYRDKLSAGHLYDFRMEFQKEEGSFVPTIVDLCLEEDEMVDCRVVYISNETSTYFAVLDPSSNSFDRFKQSIDYIAIPFRVLFCANGVHVKNEELLLNSYKVRVRVPRNRHDVVNAIHVEHVIQSPKDPAYFITNGSVWLRTTVKFQNASRYELLCPLLEQKIIDVNGVTAAMSLTQEFTVHAQFVLMERNVPVFVVRQLASTVREHPRTTNYPSRSLNLSYEVSGALARTNPNGQLSAADNNIVLINDSISLDHNLPDTGEYPTILNESSFERQLLFDNQSIADSASTSGDFILTESVYESSSAASTCTVIDRNDARFSALNDDSNILISESWLDSTNQHSETTMDTPEIITESFYESTHDQASSRASTVDRLASDVDKISIGRPDYSPPPRRRIFGYSTPGDRVRPRNSYGSSSSGSLNGRPKRRAPYGFRQIRNITPHNVLLRDIIYNNINNRKMFVEQNKNAILKCWNRLPLAQVTRTKKIFCTVIAVESIKFPPSFDDTCIKGLVRFAVVYDDMNVKNTSVVVPIGGNFNNLPKSFQLGDAYKVFHFSSYKDLICRIGGFSHGLNGELSRVAPVNCISNPETVNGRYGQRYLRCTVNAARPAISEIESDVFELWTVHGLPGFIIVEKVPLLMNHLNKEPINPDVHHQHMYTCIIEPLAGGPVEASILKDVKEGEDICIFWRLVVEFSDTVPLPRLKEKTDKVVPQIRTEPVQSGTFSVDDYGCWETLRINSILAQEKLDRMRAVGDPRVKMIDGPDLRPEIEVRKVDVNTRREKMFAAFDALLEKLPQLHSEGILGYVLEDDLRVKIKKLTPMNDNNHKFTFTFRNGSLEIGVNYLTDMLTRGKIYKVMNEMKKHVPLLKVLSDCIGLNTTYIKKTDAVTMMLQFMYRNELHTYM